ncbi:alpha/beta fold hydrolase [Massilia pseudoviolaceinigra]|uniref:alpha/beta fold hydrolase n=1 Tax=Massilia pseudoviolaceinigra TaxID=3057165 RepID=UPI002796CAE5|nr:alpha/beta fold hydrolase [Massilia sp. CCM 9206]MDQ1922161.1 alpha/beta fold hydrolase [Massilia sp. CCM 9206]
MKLKHCLAASLLSLLSALAPPCLASAPGAPLNGRTCHLPGSEEGLRCRTLAVPLDYRQPTGPTLTLHITVAPAFRESGRPDPLFVLAGGPGQAGSDVLPALNAMFRRTRATRDIVFIDQRGTGLSGKLDCDDDALPENLSDEEQIAAVRACLAAIRQPLSAYTTEHAARDIEQVRLALGYQQINVWGASYGTRLGQAYARAFPHAVRSLVLDGVAAPDQIIPAGGRDGQAALDALFRQCAADAGCNKAYPALRAEFDGLLAKVSAGPVPLNLSNPRTAEPLQMNMTRERFLNTVHNVLYSALDGRRLPFLIHSAHLGRWAPFVARRNVASDLAGEGGTALVLHMAVICAEDYPRMTPQLLADDAHNSFLGGGRVGQLIELCKSIKVPAVAWRAPSPILAPALLLSGALDPVTPPRRAEAAARHIPKAQHLVVANAGHGISALGCAPRLLREFLDAPQKPVVAHCLNDIPAANFQIGSAGPHP